MSWFKKKSLKEQSNEWISRIRKDEFSLNRNLRELERQQASTEREIRDNAKKNKMDICMLYGRQLISQRRAVARLYTAKSQLNSIRMNIREQQGILRTTGAMQKSAQVMAAMQSVLSLPVLQETMQNLSREMIKAGIIGETVSDAVEGVIQEEGDDEEAEEEVKKVLDEILIDKVSGLSLLTPGRTESTQPSAHVDELDKLGH